MSLDRTSADNGPIVSRSAAGEAIGDALRLYIGRGRRYSVKEASNGSGVPDRAIECAMCDPDATEWRRLAPEYLLSLGRFLGPEFFSAAIKPTSMGAYWLPDGDGDAASLNTDSAEFNFEYARATDPTGPGGSQILPEERHRLRVVASRMMPRARSVAA